MRLIIIFMIDIKRKLSLMMIIVNIYFDDYSLLVELVFLFFIGENYENNDLIFELKKTICFKK